MIIRIFLWLLILGCGFGAYFLLKKTKKHKIFGVLMSILGVAILGLFIFTVFEMALPVQSKINKETVTRHISNNPNEAYECPVTYKFENKIGGEAFGMYQILKIETDGAPTQKEIEDIFLNKIDEVDFIYTSELEDKLYRSLCSSLTVVSENNDIYYYFFPSLAEPYPSRSFLFEGCTYSYLYSNFFAWYHNDAVYIYVEQCETAYEKTLTDELLEDGL